MRRVIGKILPGAPHETLLVLDGTMGQNAFSQARIFKEVAGVTGVVLTKLDGTAKGGVVIGISEEFDLPVKLVGVGEKAEDLRPFDAAAFAAALFPDAD
jgi:fused signal recognition particle receptor